jgi:DHA1 family 2-module integral membrane pump EmrD-like MFS transporter
MKHSIALPYTKSQQTFIFVAAIIFLSVGQLSTDIYIPSVPSIIKYLSTTTSSLQLTISLYFIGYGISQLFYGPLSDHFGRRPVILISLSVYIVGTLFCLFAKNYEMLLIGRIIQGAGIGAAGSIASAIPHDIYSGKQIAQAFGFIGIAVAITPLIAPVLGGYLQSFFGWHASFFFLFSYASIFLAIIFFAFPETNPRVKSSKLSFFQISKTYFRMLCDKIFFVSLLSLIVILLNEILYIVWMPIILQIHFKMTPVQNGWTMIFPALGLAAGSYISSQLAKNHEKESLILLGISCIFISSSALYLFSKLSGFNPYLIVSAMTIHMVGSGIAFPLCIAICTGRYTETPGTAGALMSASLMSGAGLLGSLIISTKIMPYDALPLVLVISSSALIAIGLMLFINERNLKNIAVKLQI